MSPLPTFLSAVELARRLRRAPTFASVDPADLERLRRLPAQYGRLTGHVMGRAVPTVAIRDLHLTGPQGHDLRVRLLTPLGPGPRPIVVFFHGGGWSLGSVESYTPLCSDLANRAGVVVASVDYRLAPEHPAPAAVDDCLHATTWISRHAADLGGDAERIGVAGDSAGGNLAAVTAQLTRDAGGPALRHQALIYPATDSVTFRRSKSVRARDAILPRADLDAYLRHYLGPGPDALSPRDPRISPIFGDLTGLPPALVQTAGLDPLRDEGRAYADALRAAGVEVTCTDYPGAPHGFASWPGLVPAGRTHRAELADQVRRHLHGPDTAGHAASAFPA